MKKNLLGRTGLEVSRVGYAGIVSMHVEQDNSDKYVKYALDKGINYFDIAPSYNDAQEKMGLSLKDYRKDVYLACKTVKRDAEGAKIDMENSLKMLYTDHFDVYQLHSITTFEDVDTVFGKGGAFEVILKAKEEGVIRNIGMSCHSEEAAMYALKQYDFDTILFPTNWALHMGKQFGSDMMNAVKERNMGFIGMKSLIHRAWKNDAEKEAYPKSWCKPIYGNDELAIAAMKYATQEMGAQILIPPGNFEHFSYIVENVDIAFSEMTAKEKELLNNELVAIDGMQIF